MHILYAYFYRISTINIKKPKYMVNGRLGFKYQHGETIPVCVNFGKCLSTMPSLMSETMLMELFRGC